MKCYDWDQLLDTEDMLTLTEEALTPKPARPLSWKRLGALAACLALILCLTNYQALATGGTDPHPVFLRGGRGGNRGGSPYSGG